MKKLLCNRRWLLTYAWTRLDDDQFDIGPHLSSSAEATLASKNKKGRLGGEAAWEGERGLEAEEKDEVEEEQDHARC